MKNCLKRVILLCLLLSPLMSIAEGFTAGTLVLTSTGYVSIEDIQINDEVVCFDACGRLTKRPVVFVAQKKVSTYFRIYFDDIFIQAAENQRFYSAHVQTWIAASHIQNGELLKCKENNGCVVQYVERIDEIVTIYLLGVAGIHNFCVSYARYLCS